MVVAKDSMNGGLAVYFVGFESDVLGLSELSSMLPTGVKVISVPTFPDSESTAAAPAPALILAAYNGVSSLELLERVKFQWHGTNVMMCFSKDQGELIPGLLAKGLDDYIEMPTEANAIARRVSLRLTAFALKTKEGTRQVGPLTIDLMHRTVSNGQETSYLTPIETKIVTTLADQMGAVVERNSMKQLCWGDTTITDNALNRKIYEVRRTLRKLSRAINIRTIYGLGFELDVSDVSNARAASADRPL